MTTACGFKLHRCDRWCGSTAKWAAIFSTDGGDKPSDYVVSIERQIGFTLEVTWPFGTKVSPAAPGKKNKTRLCSAAKPSVLFFFPKAGVKRNEPRSRDLHDEKNRRAGPATTTHGKSGIIDAMKTMFRRAIAFVSAAGWALADDERRGDADVEFVRAVPGVEVIADLNREGGDRFEVVR